jgi:ATP-binding cassette subfamily B (MDR/TAP) protein 1
MVLYDGDMKPDPNTTE